MNSLVSWLSVRIWSVMNSGPVAQFIPKAKGFAYLSDAHIASMVWPASIEPFCSMVTEIMKGISAASSRDRKSTRLNSSHVSISYAVFCLKKKKQLQNHQRREIDTITI